MLNLQCSFLIPKSINMKKYLFLALALIAITSSNATSPAIGDYYFADGTTSSMLGDKTPIGVVFKVNDDNKSGRVVCLDEIVAAWSTENVYVLGAESMDSGQTNMADIIAHDPSCAKYPAFTWAHEKNPLDTTYVKGKKDVWYLPSDYELQDLCKAVKKVNTQLVAISGATLLNTNIESDTTFYWSSTEYYGYGNNARFVDFSNGKNYYSFNKSRDYRVRAVLAF